MSLLDCKKKREYTSETIYEFGDAPFTHRPTPLYMVLQLIIECKEYCLMKQITQPQRCYVWFIISDFQQWVKNKTPILLKARCAFLSPFLHSKKSKTNQINFISISKHYTVMQRLSE